MHKSFGLFQNILLQESCDNFVSLHSDFNRAIKCREFGSKKYFIDGKRGVCPFFCMSVFELKMEMFPFAGKCGRMEEEESCSLKSTVSSSCQCDKIQLNLLMGLTNERWSFLERLSFLFSQAKKEVLLLTSCQTEMLLVQIIGSFPSSAGAGEG